MSVRVTKEPQQIERKGNVLGGCVEMVANLSWFVVTPKTSLFGLTPWSEGKLRHMVEKSPALQALKILNNNKICQILPNECNIFYIESILVSGIEYIFRNSWADDCTVILCRRRFCGDNCRGSNQNPSVARYVSPEVHCGYYNVAMCCFPATTTMCR